jgi:hypothetical protein
MAENPEYEAPLYVNILIPSEGRGRGMGVYSTTHEAGNNVHIRLNPEDNLLLTEAAAILSMPITTFMREASHNVAKKLLEHKEEYDAYLKSHRDRR